uniref:Uncharacterized protein n=1 Tax=Cacopsylla melanoneura TaxID=428564 RepID=A0A8D8QFM6_9HEMI
MYTYVMWKACVKYQYEHIHHTVILMQLYFQDDAKLEKAWIKVLKLALPIQYNETFDIPKEFQITRKPFNFYLVFNIENFGGKLINIYLQYYTSNHFSYHTHHSMNHTNHSIHYLWR